MRRVVPRRGTPYEHRCSAAAFENVAGATDERDEPFTVDDLRATTTIPFSQVAVALAFLKERGCLSPVHEYHALREGAPGA